MITIRQSTEADAPGMAAVLKEIIDSWGSNRPTSAEHVRDFYISHPDRLSSAVAVDEDGQIIGFQILKRASAGNPYGVAEGWGIIGSYVALNKGGMGIGRKMFAETLAHAKAAKLPAIDATIGKDNPTGLAYYEAMGFVSYRETETADCKKLDLT